MLWTGFLIGLLGSWHCVGMCGPIALMVPGSKGRNRFLAITLYHSGKIISYLLMGSLFGMIPALLFSFKIQALTSLIIGGVMILLALSPILLSKFENSGYQFADRYFKLKNKLIASLKKDGAEYGFYVGILNGFVPCGMVYVAALGALSQTSFTDSLLFMLFFGIGTLPLMTIFMISAGFLKQPLLRLAPKLRMISFIVVGSFMIWKGVSHYNDVLNPPKEGEKFETCEVIMPNH